MHINSIGAFAMGLVSKLIKILPVAFWIFLIFSFDKPFVAILTILCAAVHESGHIASCLVFKKGTRIRSSLFGVRLKTNEITSYKQEMIIAASGPIANIVMALLTLPIQKLCNGAFLIFGILNLFTAIANLLPLKGYDGYRIISCILALSKADCKLQILSKISLTINFLLCFTSIYIMLVLNSGYWIYFLFLCNAIKELKDALPTKNEIIRENTSISKISGVFHGKKAR